MSTPVILLYCKPNVHFYDKKLTAVMCTVLHFPFIQQHRWLFVLLSLFSTLCSRCFIFFPHHSGLIKLTQALLGLLFTQQNKKGFLLHVFKETFMCLLCYSSHWFFRCSQFTALGIMYCLLLHGFVILSSSILALF